MTTGWWEIGPSVDDPRDTPANQARQDAYERLMESCCCDEQADPWCPAHGDQEHGAAALA